MSERKRIVINNEEKAQLDWAFSIVNEIMMKNDLAVLKSKSLSLVVTYLGEE